MNRAATSTATAKDLSKNQRRTVSSSQSRRTRDKNVSSEQPHQRKARPKSVQETSLQPSQALKDREEEFRKVNAELEKKTAVLVKQAEEMIQKGNKSYLELDNDNDGESDDDNEIIDVQLSLAQQRKSISKRKSLKTTDVSFTGETISADIEKTVRELEKRLDKEGLSPHAVRALSTDPDIPEELGSEAMIRYLKAKLRVLQEEHDHLSKELSQKEKDLSVAEAKVKEITEINLKLERSQHSTQQQIGKYQKLAQDAQMKCEGLETQLISLKREVEAQKSNFRKTSATEGAVKVRLNRALEDLEKYKTLYNRLKTDTKDSAKNDKSRIEELEGEKKLLERQKAELITAFKKQMKLIDVLKRQKVHLEAARMLAFTEEEFMKALDIEKTKKT